MFRGAVEKLYVFVTRPRGVFITFWVYVLAFAVLRVLGSPNIGTDDVQQALAAQSWAWGYEPRNPPLYTWLLMGAYTAFGVNQIAHVFVKYALMLATFVFAYLAGRRMFKTPGFAELSALSLMLVHLIGISLHSVFTHTVALSAALFMCWWAGLRVLQEGRARDYALLGLAVALGLLAKYNFVIFVAPLFVATALKSETRSVILNWRMLLTLGVVLVLLGPHLVWAADAHFDFADRLRKSSGVGAHENYLLDVAAGVGDLATTLVTELAPFWIVALLCFWRRPRASHADEPEAHRLLYWSLLLNLALVLIFVFAEGATDIKSRYLAPFILQAPMALFTWLEDRHVARARLKAFLTCVVVGAASVYAGLFWQSFFYHGHCKNCWRDLAIPDLAQHLRDEAGFRDGTIIASEWHLGGNMRLQFPDAAVVEEGFAETSTPRHAGQCVMVWDAWLEGTAPPEDMVAFATERLGAAPAGSPVYVSASLLHSHHRLDRLAYWIVPNADGNCRRQPPAP